MFQQKDIGDAMRMMTCEKRQNEENIDAASVLGRLAEMSHRAKRYKKSSIMDEPHNIVTFSHYYNDEFDSESESEDEAVNVSDYNTGKEMDSEESPSIELEIQDIRVTKGHVRNDVEYRSRREGMERYSKTDNDSLPSTNRFKNALRDYGTSMDTILCSSRTPLSRMFSTWQEFVQANPILALEQMNTALRTYSQQMDSSHFLERKQELSSIMSPILTQLWDTAYRSSLQEVRLNLACWRTEASEIRGMLRDTIAAQSSGDHTPLLERCLDFMSSVSLCNLVRDDSVDVRDLAVLESVNSLCNTLATHEVNREQRAKDTIRKSIISEQDDSPSESSHFPPSPPHEVEESDVDVALAGCAKCKKNSGELMVCDNGCGKEYHAACLKMPAPPDEGSWYCPPCMKSVGLTGNGQVFMCAALHCKRISVTRYCAVHSCRFKGCNFRLRGRGYCRRHDTHQKRSVGF